MMEQKFRIPTLVLVLVGVLILGIAREYRSLFATRHVLGYQWALVVDVVGARSGRRSAFYLMVRIADGRRAALQDVRYVNPALFGTSICVHVHETGWGDRIAVRPAGASQCPERGPVVASGKEP